MTINWKLAKYNFLFDIFAEKKIIPQLIGESGRIIQ